MELTLTGASLVSNNAGEGGVPSATSATTTSSTTRRSIMNGDANKLNANPSGVRSATLPLPSSSDRRANGSTSKPPPSGGGGTHGHSHTNGHPESSCQHGNGQDGHDHSHSHDHGHCQHHHQHRHIVGGGGAGAGAGAARMMPMAMPPRPDVSTREGRAEALSSAVKFGSFEQFRRAVDLVPETSKSDELDGYLPDGHTLAHWATKRCPDVRFLRLLADVPGGGVDLHRQSRDEVGMFPIHWAATEEDSIGVASFLLARIGDRDADTDAADDVKPSSSSYGMMTVNSAGMGGSMTEGMPAVPPSTLFDGGTEGTPRRQRSSLLPRPGPLHARDKSGCTPLLVAAQYGRANLAAFLIKRGADPSALDHSRDSALHWAAYKGNVAVAGLLLHLAGDSGGDHEGNSLPLDAPDKYGQTPLHLAALRGNSDVLEYFLEEAEHAYASSASSSALRQPPPSPVRRSNHGGRFRSGGGGGGLRRLFGGRSAASVDAMDDNDLDLRLTTSTPASSSQSLQSTSSSSTRGTTPPSPGSLLQMTDDEGRTPLDLASKYNRKGCELVLREWIDRYHVHERAGGRNLGDRVVRFAVLLRGGARQLFSVDSWRAWMGLGLGGGSGKHGEGDADLGHVQRQVKWPLVLVLLCMTLSAAMYPLRFVRGDMVLTGGKSAFWHIFTITSMAVMWVTFVLTWRTNPGCIQTLDKAAGSRVSGASAGGRRRKLTGSGVGGGSGGDDIDVELHRIATELRSQYDEALERYAEDRSEADDPSSPMKTAEPVPPLCHTCRIVRPLRSKHCRVQRRCVLVFDHYCPFVGNTVGLYNYRYFYGFLVSLVTSEIGFITTWVKYLVAAPGWDLFALSAGILCGVFIVPGIGMAWYHTILVGRNLTTNEHQNMWRYRYLRDGRTGAYRNPFDGGILNNAHGRMFPDEKQYTLPASTTVGGGGMAAGAEGTTETLSIGSGGSTANGVTGDVQGDEEKEELLSRMV